MDVVLPGNEGSQKLAIERFDDQSLTYLRFSGSIDEHFDGKKLASSIRAGTLVLHLGDVHRMSSFGIREWADFVDHVTKSGSELILIECSPKVMDQLNMVANFAGSGRVFSFYAPYRCDYCDSDDRILFQVDRDWEIIKGRKPPELPCATCGELEHFDEDPITFFSYMAKQGPFELADEIRVLLATASKLDHAVAEVEQRLRVDKRVEGRITCIKLSGDVDATFPRAKLAEGLEGVIILDLSDLGKLDPAGAAEWRTFLQMITPTAEAIYLLGMPPLFLEKLGSVADLGARTQLLSFAMLYSCTRCGVTAPYMVDVEKHHELLRFATAPEMRCRDCKAPATCIAPKEVIYQLSSLPRPDIQPRVRAFLESVDRRKPTRGSTRVEGRGRRSWVAFAAMAAVALAVLGVGALGYLYFKGRGEGSGPAVGMGAMVEASAGERPAWIVSDTPLGAECKTDASLKMSCMGVSSYAGDQNAARQQARDAALDEMIRQIGLLIDDPEWSTQVGAAYGRVRQARLAAFLDEGLRAPGSLQHQRAEAALIDGRKAVIAALRRTGGDIVAIDTPADQYHERYAGASGSGPRYLAFARHALSSEQVQKLIELYSRSRDALGVTVMTAYPGLAWRYPGIEAGAIIISLGKGFLRDAGAARGYIVTAIQGRSIKDADGFARTGDEEADKLEKEGGSLRITVTPSEGEPTELTTPVARAGESEDGQK
jgi:anti-anti-sigma regulatory factor